MEICGGVRDCFFLRSDFHWFGKRVFVQPRGRSQHDGLSSSLHAVHPLKLDLRIDGVVRNVHRLEDHLAGCLVAAGLGVDLRLREERGFVALVDERAVEEAADMASLDFDFEVVTSGLYPEPTWPCRRTVSQPRRGSHPAGFRPFSHRDSTPSNCRHRPCERLQRSLRHRRGTVL